MNASECESEKFCVEFALMRVSKLPNAKQKICVCQVLNRV